ncbi:hypothetical protein GOBAR_DD28684 [Gossypium barbadense]|nr:hypothetical protein GOBAR_DD28684 [Gossypium barbadense]
MVVGSRSVFMRLIKKLWLSMKTFTDKRRNASSDGGNSGFKMKQLPFMGVICSVTLYIVYRTTNYQYYETQMETKLHPFDSVEDNELPSGKLKDLPRGIMHTRSDLELRPQWRKSLRWFAKRFLHPDIVSTYDYIFLWDEDLGVEHFNPGRYLEIVKSEGLEISQPALDPNSTEIHHRITIRSRMKKFHRRVYELRGKTRCSNISEGPPCSGFVEGMAPVFSRAAWRCAWHLIQNDLVHGWGMDMKLGYCAQGDRTKNAGVIDREYIVHKGIQTLGGTGELTKKTKKLCASI